MPRFLTSLALLCGVCLPLVSSQRASAAPRWNGHEGVLQGVENAHAVEANGVITLARADRSRPMTLHCHACQGLGVQRDADQWWVLPLNASGAAIEAATSLWVVPADAEAREGSWYMELHGGNGESIAAKQSGSDETVEVQADTVTLRRAETRPHSDIFGHHFAIEVKGDHSLEQALATFYWGTMLPSVVERTMAAKFPYSRGYVLSTLETSQYAGSYPAVDHEFQILGRLAVSSPFDLDLVRRMLELQLQLMQDDPEHLSRAPTSVQPDGRREYHIRRDSEDHRENAGMFPVTGNIEVLQETWRWYQATHDRAWLAAHIPGLEGAAGWVLANTDQFGRVWSDVYYEDQVIKDGRVTQAQAFAAHAFQQLALMEDVLGRTKEAATYRDLSQKMARVLVAPLPDGYWDADHRRFVDWVDRNAQVHDHVHLLANTVPVTLGFATDDQRAAVAELVKANESEFERFPSFLSPHIGEYTQSEIGIAGPYDLSAAGRYWYWDAAYRASQNQGAMLLTQLQTVAAEAAKDHGFMGERYDMDHVFYVDGKDAHGAVKYYEYPNVFAAVLLSKLLGLTSGEDADIDVQPHLPAYASVSLQMPAYALEYRWNESGFTLTNLSDKPRRFAVELAGLGSGTGPYRLQGGGAGAGAERGSTLVTLGPHQQAHWTGTGTGTGTGAGKP